MGTSEQSETPPDAPPASQDVQAFKTALDGSGIQVRLLEWYPE